MENDQARFSANKYTEYIIGSTDEGKKLLQLRDIGVNA